MASAVLAAALWLALVLGRGFAFTADSMSYAALARGFDAGRWFTSAILAWGMTPGRFRSEWPPLYPAVLAALHALGPALPWCELAVSGAGLVAAAGFGALAVREASGGLSWAAVPLLAGFPPALYVADHGWSEPLFLGLLGLHFWLAARAAASPRAPGPWRFFPQALVAGLAFLDRYAGAAFLPAAVVMPALLGRAAGDDPPGDGRARRRKAASGRGRGLRAGAVAALAVALPVVPWAAACLILTGSIGTRYPPAAAGVGGVLGMLVQGLAAAAAWLVAGGGTSVGRLPLLGLAAAEAACGLLGAALARGSGRQGGRGTPARAAVGLLLSADAVLSAALVLGLRLALRFDPVHLRLLTPSLYTAALALLVWLSCLPWGEVRAALLLPPAALALWHGGAWAAAGLHSPALPAAMRGPWCTPGPQGDCALLGWLSAHTTDSDLILGNAAFTVNFQLGRTAMEIEPPPVDPVLAAADVRRWTLAWDAAHPRGAVYLVLDAAVAPLQGGEPVLSGLASGTGTSLPGLAATEVASGPAYGVWLLSPAAAALGGLGGGG